MRPEDDRSLGDEATLAGASKLRSTAEASLGDQRTLGDSGSAQDTIIEDIDVVDLEARYTIQGTLGQGGMGAVLLANDTRLDRKVAIKRILGEASGNRMAVQRFLTEAKSIAALNHPNIVQIFDYGRAKDGPFLIMEYVDGGSLLERCRASALPLDEAIALACQLCDGLAKAHGLGIIHRDIKPANVLLTKDGIPKLTDFGLAKAKSADHGMTMNSAVLGTPDFMPPEQRQDSTLVDHRSDVWSLAATVYQMATGRSPKVIRLHELPQQLQPIIAKALEEEKDTRYQSAGEFREALKGISGGTRNWTGPAQIGCALQEGQCKACGTVTSDLTRKFCRNPQCRAGLRVACLNCDAQIAVWDGVCGECGGRQSILLAAKRESLTAARAEAEVLLAGFAFDESIARARRLADEAHVDLAEFAAWGGEFLASATAERERQRALGEERLHAARIHLGAWDYPAAIQAIESIPAPLRDAEKAELLEQCGERRRASDELIATIAIRISRKEIDGLLSVVEQAIALRGDRQDLVKIRGQLVEWHERKQAKTLSQPRFSNSIGIELKLLPSGTFNMGQAGGESDETPHQATLSRSFHIGVYPVTNFQWKRLMGTVPGRWTDNEHPVEGVSWDDAAEFCRRISALPEERQVGRVYRLPTEAEWEYACRAGSTARYSFGDEESRLGEYGWYGDKSGGTHPVGQKKPNAWGLYDMYGNVWELCSDWYQNYADIATVDPHVTEAPRIERPINEFVVPDYGESVASATVIKVFVSSGDWVEQEQKFLKIETETMFIETTFEGSGRLKELLVSEGQIVKPRQVLATLEHGRTVERPRRVLRGGGWFDRASRCRSASRMWMWPFKRFACVGFRVAMSQPKVARPKAVAVE